MRVSKTNITAPGEVGILPIAELAPSKKSTSPDGATSNCSYKRTLGSGQRRLKTETVSQANVRSLMNCEASTSRVPDASETPPRAANALEDNHQNQPLTYVQLVALVAKYRESSDPYPFYIYGKTHSIFYAALAANDVGALQNMAADPGCDFWWDHQYLVHNGQHAKDRYRLWRVMDVLHGMKDKIPYESLEFLIRCGKIRKFPCLLHNYDLRLFLLGNERDSESCPIVVNKCQNDFFLPNINSWHCYHLSTQSGRKYFYDENLKINPEDSQELILKKKEWHEVFGAAGNFLGHPGNGAKK